MKLIHVQRPSPTKSSPDIFIISHSKQKKQLHTQKPHRNYNHLQNALQSISKHHKQLQPVKNFEILRSSVENHRQNIDRLTDVLKEKSWRKIRKDKSVRIMLKWLTKQCQKLNIKRIITAALSFLNQQNCEVSIQQYGQKRFIHFDRKGDFVQRRSKNFDQNGELVTLINQQAKLTKQKATIQNNAQQQIIDAIEEKSRSRSNSQRSLSKNLYVIRKNTKVDPKAQKKAIRTTSQKVISYKQQQITKQKGFKSAQNIQDVMKTPTSKGNPQQKSSQTLNDNTPSFSMKIPRYPEEQKQSTAKKAIDPKSKLLHIVQKQPINAFQGVQSQLKQSNWKLQVKKPIAAIENYYFPTFQQPQEATKQPEDNKVRSRNLGKISFSYEDRQKDQKNKNFVPNKQQFMNDYPQIIKQLPISSRAQRNPEKDNRQRSHSLPKITFTYTNKNITAFQRQTINTELSKDKPVISPKNEVKPQENRFTLKQNPHLTRHMILENARHENKQIFILQKRNNIPAHKQVKLKVSGVNGGSKSNSKLKIPNSPHQIKLNLKNHQRPQMKVSEYYVTCNTGHAETAKLQANGRKRVKSYDLFIWRRPGLMKEQKLKVNGVQRVRTMSCNPKLQVALQNQSPMIKAY